jgi:Mlc titration factor MtfA (ptsG expression regulator)
MPGLLGQLVRWFAGLEPTSRGPDLERRAALRAAPLPPEWRAIVETHVGVFSRLSPAQQQKLLGDLAVFAGEKEVHGADGFVVDDRVRVLVAASAALLVLGRDIAAFDHVVRVEVRHTPEREGDEAVAGRYRGRSDGDDNWGFVELSWTSVLRGLALDDDGSHVALHEFAHAFDHAESVDPAYLNHPHADLWRVRIRGLARGHDVQGSELFAIATEQFFERPRALHRVAPDLFAALVEIYAIDPREFGDG